MTANPRLVKGQTGVSPQRPTLESHRKGAKGAKGNSQERKMEVKFLGLQSRSEFTGRLLIGLPVLAFLVRRPIDRAGWSLLGAPGVPHGLQFPDFIR